MTDLLPTIAPKSDQLNADDLIGRTLDIRITKISLCGEADQPIAVHFEGDNGKPYKPCKSMRRVMVNVWGSDGNAFIGRRMRLYRDEKVQFGGQAVGGIRISHMSDIDADRTMALTTTRAHRKPYTVRPLPSGAGDPPTVDLTKVLAAGRAAAAKGSAALAAWWTPLSKAEKAAAKATLDGELKATATKADQAALNDDPAGDPNPDHDPQTGEVIDAEIEGAGEALSSSGPDVSGEPATAASEAPAPSTDGSGDGGPVDLAGSDFDPIEWAGAFNRNLANLDTVDEVAAAWDEAKAKGFVFKLKSKNPELAKQLAGAVNARVAEIKGS